jgi:hypothetical protein
MDKLPLHYENTLAVKLALLVTVCAASICTVYVVNLTNQTTERLGTYEALFPVVRGQVHRNLDTGIAVDPMIYESVNFGEIC